MFFSQTVKGLFDTQPSNANNHALRLSDATVRKDAMTVPVFQDVDSDADEDMIRVPKRKRATHSPLADTPAQIITYDGAAPSSLRRKASKKEADDSACVQRIYDDDSDEMVKGQGTSEHKRASKKKRTSLGMRIDADVPRTSNEDGLTKKTTVVKKETSQMPRWDQSIDNEDHVPLSSVPHVRFATPQGRDTFHDDWPKTKVKRKSIASVEKEEPAFVPQSDDSDDSDDSVFISQNEKSAVVFDFSTEKARRWTDAINLPENIYNETEQDLFIRLSMRGFEPVLPSHWKFDFPTLPLSLFPDPSLGLDPLLQIFSSEFYGKSMIKTYVLLTCWITTHTRLAIKSLANLFSLGGRVRDCKILRKKPEALIRHSIKDYIRWAMRDAKVCISNDAIPLHAIYAQRDGIMETLKRLDRRLHYLVGRYQKALGASTGENGVVPNTDSRNKSSNWLSRRNYPILIGFIVSGPTVVILTRNSDPTNESENSDSTFMCQFDLGERGQDVWNSLSIAITVMHIRRTMMQLAEDEVAGYRKLLEGEKLDTGPDIDL